MGLTVVLAALHLLPSSASQRQQDPEKAAGAEEEPPDEEPAGGNDDDDEDEDDVPDVDVEVDEADSVANSRRPLRRQGSYNPGTFLSRRLPHTLTWDTSTTNVSWLARVRSFIFPSEIGRAHV